MSKVMMGGLISCCRKEQDTRLYWLSVKLLFTDSKNTNFINLSNVDFVTCIVSEKQGRSRLMSPFRAEVRFCEIFLRTMFSTSSLINFAD